MGSEITDEVDCLEQFVILVGRGAATTIFADEHDWLAADTSRWPGCRGYAVSRADCDVQIKWHPLIYQCNDEAAMAGPLYGCCVSCIRG